jgi:hypothetical protein
MAFKIYDNQGEKLLNTELNREAAAFFNVPYKEGKWTSHIIVPPMDPNNRKPYIDALKESMDNNWFVKLDGADNNISFKEYATWKEVRNYLRTMYMHDIWEETMEWQLEYYQHIAESIKPIDDLIKHWMEKGYQIKFS